MPVEIKASQGAQGVTVNVIAHTVSGYDRFRNLGVPAYLNESGNFQYGVYRQRTAATYTTNSTDWTDLNSFSNNTGSPCFKNDNLITGSSVVRVVLLPGTVISSLACPSRVAISRRRRLNSSIRRSLCSSTRYRSLSVSGNIGCRVTRLVPHHPVSAAPREQRGFSPCRSQSQTRPADRGSGCPAPCAPQPPASVPDAGQDATGWLRP